MSMALEEVARNAIELPRHQRLALARLLIELDDPGADTDVEAAWDAEIQARLRAVKEDGLKAFLMKRFWRALIVAWLNEACRPASGSRRVRRFGGSLRR